MRRIGIALFFFIFFCVGLFVFDDYGISMDESVNRENARLIMSNIFDKDPSILSNPNRKYHGAAFELILYGLEKALGLSAAPRTYYLMRHLMTFFMFYLGVIFFYKLCLDRFRHWQFSLLGPLFLILSPRIFADSFYNSKDLVFLSLFIIAVYTLINFLDRKTARSAVVHSLVCGLLVDVRAVGIIIPVLSLFFYLVEIINPHKEERADHIPKRDRFRKRNVLLLFVFLTAIFIFVFWPTLWTHPVQHMMEAFRYMVKFPVTTRVLYLGEFVSADSLPWHYVPVWILITTPLVYIFFFIIGFLSLGRQLIKSFRPFLFNRRNDFIYLLWIVLPVAAAIIFRSTLYNGYRHLFFVYPALLMVALIGLNIFCQMLKSHFRYGICDSLLKITAMIIFLNCASVLSFMIRNHPYQNVYFNRLAGPDMPTIQRRFEMDYWGLSFRKGLEYLLNHNNDEKISIVVPDDRYLVNTVFLSRDQQKRLFLCAPGALPKRYLITNYRDDTSLLVRNGVYKIDVDGAKILGVHESLVGSSQTESQNSGRCVDLISYINNKNWLRL